LQATTRLLREVVEATLFLKENLARRSTHAVWKETAAVPVAEEVRELPVPVGQLVARDCLSR